jgi:4-hydroxyacetophenone monooxygenase
VISAVSVLSEPVAGAPLHRETLTGAMKHANLPTLVVVLYQLTGDRCWLADPFRPTHSRGIEDNDSGGRRAGSGRDPGRSGRRRSGLVGGAPARCARSEGLALMELMRLAVGEPVSAEYEAMAADMGFRALGPVRAVPAGTGFQVVVIGAGISGMLAAIRLREAGIGCVVPAGLDRAPVTGVDRLDRVRRADDRRISTS